jgi:DNA repair protein RadC
MLALLKLPRLPKCLTDPPAQWLTEGFTPRECKVLEAAILIGRRALTLPAAPRPRILRAQDAGRALLPRLQGLHREEFWVLLLDARLGLVESLRIASGGQTQCSVLPREVLAPAVTRQLPAMMTAHNHPSGDSSPSADDQRLFLLIDDAARTMGIRVVDHLIMGRDELYSAVEGKVALQPIAAEP